MFLRKVDWSRKNWWRKGRLWQPSESFVLFWFRIASCPLFLDYLVSGIGYLVFGIWYLVFGIWYLVFGIWYLGVWYLVFGIWYWIASCPLLLNYLVRQNRQTRMQRRNNLVRQKGVSNRRGTKQYFSCFDLKIPPSRFWGVTQFFPLRKKKRLLKIDQKCVFG